jgi:acetyl esterase/lipase
VAWLVVATAMMAVVVAAGLASGRWWRPGFDPDVAYGAAAGKTLRLDIYRPRDHKGLRPAVLLIHGGGWIYGDKSSERDMAEHLAKAGYVAFAVNYRLAEDDAGRYPAPVDDVRRAVRWVRAHAKEYNVDPLRIGAMGHSAGGHLAAMLGTTDPPETVDPELKGISARVTCVVDCAGPVDLTDPELPPLYTSTGWFVPNLFGGKGREQVPELYREASPLRQVDRGTSPTLIVHGTEDDVVPFEQSRRFLIKLREAGVETALVELEGEGHLFVAPESQRKWIGAMMQFFRKHLKP